MVHLASGAASTIPAGEINPREMMVLRKEIDRGGRPGSLLFNSGPYFGTTQPGWKRSTMVEEIYDLTDEWAEHGVGGLKVEGSPVSNEEKPP